MAQINVTGKEEAIDYISKGYNQLGMNRSKRIVEVAIKDIRLLTNSNGIDETIKLDEYFDIDAISKSMNNEFLYEVNFFEPTLKKIKTKIKNNKINREIHFQYFYEYLIKKGEIFNKIKHKLKNKKALELEWIQIQELIAYLKLNDIQKILKWYNENKGTSLIYESLLNLGLDIDKINLVLDYIDKLKGDRRNIKND